MLVTLTWACVWAAQTAPIVPAGDSGLDFVWRVGCALGALFQRLIALPMTPRLLTLAAFSAPHLTLAPPFSELGTPNEGLLVAAAMLVGELLAHPFELYRRAAFAREALASGRVPDPTPDAAAAVHPLTLRFSNGALERVYVGRRCEHTV